MRNSELNYFPIVLREPGTEPALFSSADSSKLRIFIEQSRVTLQKSRVRKERKNKTKQKPPKSKPFSDKYVKLA